LADLTHRLASIEDLDALREVMRRSIEALQHDFLPPNANFQERDPQWDIHIVANQAVKAPVRRVVSNSFGFGGTNASLVLEETAV